ncbi:MAG: M20 family metallo-hydrolase [Vicinamibacterales bacterium]
MTPAVNQQRLAQTLDELAAFSDAAPPAVTRIVFTESDLRARAYVKALCIDAGLVVREDAVGNTFARWVGSDLSLAPVATGSHIDAIPEAGRFDGTVGVMGGLEAIRALHAVGFTPRRSIDLIAFTSEEPTRFGIGCLGSRLLSGALDASAGSRLRDMDGRQLDDVRRAAGFSGELESVRLLPGAYSSFVELHIEQGPLLERGGLDAGIVTAIAAPAGLRVTVEGEGGHAGAVLMPERRDAFLAAAEIALEVERAARATGAIDTVATTGVCRVFPGAVNSVPSRTVLEIDVRDIDGDRRDWTMARILSQCEDIAVRRGVTVTHDIINSDPPAQSDETIVEVLEGVCKEQQVRYQPMISRAYHDSLFMSRIAPTAMVFIPCRGGISHRPDEYSSPSAIARGTEVLAAALARLSTRP